MKLVHDLESRVRERTAELETANRALAAKNDELAELQRRKEALAALLVHDIRSPAATVVMAAPMRLDDPALAERDRRQWSHVLASGEAITRMAMNLLDIANAETAELELEIAPFDLARLLHETADAMATLAAGGVPEIDVELDAGSIEMNADRACIGRVLQSLLDNAVRYSPPKRRIRMGAQPVGTAELEIYVRDEGPGIAA